LFEDKDISYIWHFDKDMKHLLFLFLAVFAFACGTAKNGGGKNNLQEIAGRWQENWDVGKPTNIAYSDVYRLLVKDNVLTIACANHKYEFEAISFKDKVLRFRLINKDKYETDKNAAQASTYIIDYELNYDASKKNFEGQAKTNKGANVKILWERLE
jgi:hypothetical protein